ncbi:MAG TPA: hypothetical protein VGB36_07690 [Gammaproteobacteria bacterium]
MLSLATPGQKFSRPLSGYRGQRQDGAVAAHRKALRSLSPGVAEAYDAVAPLVLACAVSAGLDGATRCMHLQSAAQRWTPGGGLDSQGSRQ